MVRGWVTIVWRLNITTRTGGLRHFAKWACCGMLAVSFVSSLWFSTASHCCQWSELSLSTLAVALACRMSISWKTAKSRICNNYRNFFWGNWISSETVQVESNDFLACYLIGLYAIYVICMYIRNAEGVATEACGWEIHEEPWEVSQQCSVNRCWFNTDSVCNWFVFVVFSYLNLIL